ncbi:hypothetical protein SAMN05216228_103076 [Rhizobium tibeticum]|uniref:Uncharacterized protein n=1 Tax=Rhizobium tibeticum TaxID=501024 RepID=A0A1H8TWY4_9HYPH|nr:hypothetical protein RTCCBAU85039_5296 [Rhizobium tibeticum]SEO94928.1 hypothetical protein SAMN05216228_103076 [Rhizobium tibeticum]
MLSSRGPQRAIQSLLDVYISFWVPKGQIVERPDVSPYLFINDLECFCVVTEFLCTIAQDTLGIVELGRRIENFNLVIKAHRQDFSEIRACSTTATGP